MLELASRVAPAVPPPSTRHVPLAPSSPARPLPLQDTAPWWSKITLTQVVIVLSFTTIIGIMIGTFFFVLSTGAIRFNDQ